MLAGRIGDLIGQRRIFLIGLAVFSAASLLCALAQSQGMLIGARFVQGVGGAITAAVILGMIVTMFPEPREQAKAIGIHGGTAFRAIAGYGRHGQLHEDHFFELAGDLPVEVGFALTEADAQRLLDQLSTEKLTLFYIKAPIEIGEVGSPDEPGAPQEAK